MYNIEIDILNMKFERVFSKIFVFKDTVTFWNLSKISKKLPVKFFSTTRNVVFCNLFFIFFWENSFLLVLIHLQINVYPIKRPLNHVAVQIATWPNNRSSRSSPKFWGCWSWGTSKSAALNSPRGRRHTPSGQESV